MLALRKGSRLNQAPHPPHTANSELIDNKTNSRSGSAPTAIRSDQRVACAASHVMRDHRILPSGHSTGRSSCWLDPGGGIADDARTGSMGPGAAPLNVILAIANRHASKTIVDRRIRAALDGRLISIIVRHICFERGAFALRNADI